jgi:two-component system, sensor histidine kinase and response regulator
MRNCITTIFCICLFMISNTKVQGQNIDSLEKAYRKYEYFDTTKIEIARKIAWYNTSNNPQQSAKLCDEMLAQSLSKINEKYVYVFKMTKATALQRLNEFIPAINLFEECIELCKASKNERGLASSFTNLANTYLICGQYEKAIAYFLKSLEVAKEKNNVMNLFTTRLGIGGIYASMNNLKKAIEYYHLSVQQFEQPIPDFMDYYSNVASCFLALNKPDSAYKYVQLADKLNLSANITSPQLLNTYYNLRADYFKHIGNYTTALVEQKKALQYAYASGSNRDISKRLQMAGELFLTMKSYDSAQMYLQKGLDIAIKEKLFTEQGSCYECLVQVYEKKLQFPKAIECYSLWNATKDSLNMLQNITAVQQAEVKYRTKEKEEKNTLLEHEKNMQTKLKYVSLFAGIFLALLLSMVAWQINKRRKQYEVLNKKIELQKSELEKSNQLKDKLFSIISHDVRSPINSLRTLLQLKQSAFITQTKVAELEVNLQRDLVNTSSALDNLLYWSAGQMKGFKVRKSNTNLLQILNSQIDFLLLQLEEKQMCIETNVSGEIQILTDSNAFGIIVRNILSNAIKFSHPKTKICIKATQTESSLLLTITDFGVGFNQAQDTENRHQEKGTGLGLLLVQEYADLLEIKVNIKSELGKGTEFELSLQQSVL